MTYLLAAVDLGSNSFRLVVGRVAQDTHPPHIHLLDRMKETVRLAAGLDQRSRLDEDAIRRALAVLERFGERLRNFHPDRVRAVATNTFRVATNAHEFLPRAEAALGFPIDVISGHEEARLIYTGVSHCLPQSDQRRLIVDIGGGSTELIIGRGHEPELMESVPIGCVSLSKRFFADGRITATRMKHAEVAARELVEPIAQRFRQAGWSYAYGSSGTAKALAAILPATGFSRNGITPAGLEKLRRRLIEAGTVEAAHLQDLRPGRIPVLPGGLAVMRAIFEELPIEHMAPADGALRVGVLYDLLGRVDARDLRNETVRRFMTRYEVDTEQAARVRRLSLGFYEAIANTPPGAAGYRVPGAPRRAETAELGQLLGWAADLHEIGLSIAHAGHQQHTAYILAHADMPGFSKDEQRILAALGAGQSGKISTADLALESDDEWDALLSLRLAVLLARRREDVDTSLFRLTRAPQGANLQVAEHWLRQHPLTAHALEAEARTWRKLKRPLEILAA